MQARSFDDRTTTDAETGCILWIGSKDRDGYGRDGWKMAHRLAYEMAFGSVPTGLQIDHLCGVRNCVNPLHLDAVTAKENVHRSPHTQASINSAKTHCPHGHEYSASNTSYRKNGARRCKECHRLASKKAYAESKRIAA